MSARLTRRAALLCATVASSLAATPAAIGSNVPTSVRPSRVERVHAYMIMARDRFHDRDAALRPSPGVSLDPDLKDGEWLYWLQRWGQARRVLMLMDPKSVRDLLLIWSGILSGMDEAGNEFAPHPETAALMEKDIAMALNGTLAWAGAK